THAEAADPLIARNLRGFEDMIDREQVMACHACFIVSALWTICAIFRASAGLNREKLAKLHFAGIKILTMNALSPEQEIDQTRVVDLAHFIFSRNGHGRIMARVVQPLSGNSVKR